MADSELASRIRNTGAVTANDLEQLPKRISSRADFILFRDLDLLAHGMNAWRLGDALRNPQLRHQRILRRLELAYARTGLRARFERLWHRLRLQVSSAILGISIPPGVFGPGLSIAHHGTIVVNSGVRAGAFCHLNALVSIGKGKSGVPVLGSFVYVGPNASVFGGVSVGSFSAIGAGAVVFVDVPPGHTAVGNPARQLRGGSRESMPPWFPVAHQETFR